MPASDGAKKWRRIQNRQRHGVSLRSRRAGRLLCLAVMAAWLLGLATTVNGAEPTPLQRPEIQYLLKVVADSDCDFIRNGKIHNGQQAATHMRKKGRYFADKIHSAEDFIRLAASKSLISGRAYHVHCQGQPEKTTAGWLHAQLANWRSKSSL